MPTTPGLLQRPQPCNVPAEAACSSMLPGYDFADAFAVDTPMPLDAPTAVQRAFAQPPAWVRGLMDLRNRLVGLAGLRGAPARGFPVLRSTPSAVWMGLDDKHLDFRVAVTTAPCGTGTRVVVTTMVRRHNRWGRAYLAVVMPFHRRIAPRMLADVVRPAR